MKVLALGSKSPESPLEKCYIERRSIGEYDLNIAIKYSGICHSDIHTAKGEWGPTGRPCVPGHEIIGTVLEVGSKVDKFSLGQIVGVGVFIGSCNSCHECSASENHFCAKKVGTFGTFVGSSHTMGGYSSHIVIHQDFVLSIPDNLDLKAVAPLLCAGCLTLTSGITMYSPIKHYKIKPSDSVAVLGLGGLGHMALKFAKALGCKVTVLTTSASKIEVAKKLGADDVVLPKDMAKSERSFDFILDTVSVWHDLSAYLKLLKRDGTLIIVGGVPDTLQLKTGDLIDYRLKIGGSLVGSVKETQEMLDFCSEHNITSDIELINAGQVNEAWERVLKNDVKFRFVIDIGTLTPELVVQ